MYRLDFDSVDFTRKTFSTSRQDVTCRAYENIVYVKSPADPQYQCMHVYVPEAYCQGQSMGPYSADTAPIFFPNTVGGYLPGKPAIPRQRRNGTPNTALAALSKGYVVAAPGARGRTNRGEGGQYNGKAPACIVDLKAAVRYLRHNAGVMPGDAEKIVSNGTSAGGALSALLGVTGNHPEYEPYLKALGAADVRDDIFAASCYCPIMNLEHADMAYEWLFNGHNEYIKLAASKNTDYHAIRNKVAGTLRGDQRDISDRLKAMFPAYLNGLGLQTVNGASLSLDTNGEGAFKDYVKSLVLASAQKVLHNGKALSALTWITIQDQIVTDIDFDKYVQYTTRMKPPPAFDGLDLNTCENELFGTALLDAQHFTRFGVENSTVNGTLADAAIVKLMNPMPYIGTEGAHTARHWRIRHGTLDSDTALAIPVILAKKLENSGCNVDFTLPWDQRHGGDYDLEELFSWMRQVCSMAAQAG